MGKIKNMIKSNKILHFIFRCSKMGFYYIGEKSESLMFYIYTKMADKGLVNEDERFKKLSGLKNSYLGRRCFIICTGPSLEISDLELLKGELTISMSSIVNILDRTSFIPTIYMIQDLTSYRLMRDKFKYLKDSKILIGITNILPCFGRGIKAKKVKETNAIFYHLDSASSIFHLNYFEKDYLPKFSSDCSKKICDGATVTYSAIQLAAYLGCNEIYLLGADATYMGKRKHIDDYSDNFEHNDAQALMAAYKHKRSYSVAKENLEKNGIKIFNCTRGGELEIFERKKLEDVLY